MKNRKYSKLKRNPIVRLIRWVLRFINRLFNPDRGNYRSSRRHGLSDDKGRLAALVSITKLNIRERNGLITVGELLDRVEWQFSQEIDRQAISTDSKIHRTRDVSLN